MMCMSRYSSGCASRGWRRTGLRVFSWDRESPSWAVCGVCAAWGSVGAVGYCGEREDSQSGRGDGAVIVFIECQCRVRGVSEPQGCQGVLGLQRLAAGKGSGMACRGCWVEPGLQCKACALSRSQLSGSRLESGIKRGQLVGSVLLGVGEQVGCSGRCPFWLAIDRSDGANRRLQ